MNARFWTKAIVIFFGADFPGNHATMFTPGERLSYRDDLCVFDDDERSYTWAFDLPREFEAGQQFVFATADAQVLGIVGEDGEITAMRGFFVERVDGKPVRVVGF